MDIDLILILIFLVIAVVISLGLAVYASRKAARWATSFALLALITAGWSQIHAFELVHSSLAQKWLWFQVKITGVGFVSLLLFVFVLQYTGRFSWLKPATWLLLAIRPLAALPLIWVPALNYLIATDLSIARIGAIPVLAFTVGIGTLVFGIYDFLLVLFSTLLLCSLYLRSSSLARRQLLFLLAAILLPWLGSLVSFWRLPAFSDVDLVPIFLAVSLSILALGYFRYRLFDLLPVAHEVVLSSMEDGIIILDQHQRIMEVNLAGQKILGQDPAAYLGFSVEEALASWPALQRMLLDGLAGGAEISLDQGQEQRLYEVRKSVLQVDQKQPGGLLILLRDITEQARLEKALRRSETKYRSVAERGNDGIAILQGGLICYCNPQLARMVGKTTQQLMGLPLAKIISPGTKDEVVEHLTHQMYELYEPTRYEVSLSQADGTLIEVELSISMIEFEDQPALLAFVRDVSRRNRSLQLARENEERYRRISDLISDFAYACRIQPDGQLVSIWATGAFTRITGFSLESMDPYSALMTHIAPEDSYTAFNHTSRLFEGKPDVAEYRIVNKEGQIRWIRDYVRPVWDVEENRVTWFYGASQDITERKLMEENLRQAKEAAEAATLAKSQFLANMSHEIRTPLNAMIGMTSLLLDTPLGDEQREYVETIRTSGDALLELINEILDFSKIEAERLDLENSPLNLRQCLEDALDIVMPHALDKPLDLVYEIGPQVPQVVVGDVARLRQILVNLISNAIKFTPAGEVAICIARGDGPAPAAAGAEVVAEAVAAAGAAAAPLCATPVDGALAEGGAPAEGGRPAPAAGQDAGSPCEILITVRDTGIGIPPDRIHRLFQSFSQIDPSTTRKYGGTGLGLAITRRLVELMGGQISVESQPGTGSTFQVSIPFAVAEPPLPAQPAPDWGWLAGMRFLVVDDNATNRRMLARQLQSWGVQVELAASGAEALETLARGTDYQLALLDLQMPQMDGLLLAQEIRRRLPEPHFPLVLLTPMGQHLQPDPGNGLAGCLIKPVKPAQLAKLLAEVLAPGRADGPQPAVAPLEPVGPEFAMAYPLRVLVAEDNLANQKVALRMLQRLGYWADVAANGSEALDALERQPYDLVLMDVEMPEMDGIEATRRIHQRWGQDRPFRIIAATAFVFQEDLDRCLAAGMDGYITKPIELEALMEVLRQAADPERSAAPAPARPSRIPEGVINTTRMQDLSASLGAALREVIQSFLEDTPALIVELKAAYQRGDMDEVQRIAHSLKSSSGIFGAQAMMDLCHQVELAARTSTLPDAQPLMDILLAFEEIRAVLNLYLADGKAGG